MAQEKLFITLHRPSIVRRDGKVLVRDGYNSTRLGLRGQVFADRAQAEAAAGGRDVQVFEVTGTFPDGAIFEVTENSDQIEGKGSMVRVGLFSTFALAVQVAKGRGGMGTGYGHIEMISTTGPAVFDTMEDFRAAAANGRPSQQSSVSLMDYSGLNLDYFAIADERQSDPQYQEYLRLKAVYGN